MGHQYSHAPGRPILHRRLILSQTSAGKLNYFIDRLLILLCAVPLFVPGGRSFVPTCGPRTRRAQGPSRLAVAQASPLASVLPGYALYEAFQVKRYFTAIFTFFISVSLFDLESRFFARPTLVVVGMTRPRGELAVGARWTRAATLYPVGRSDPNHDACMRIGGELRGSGPILNGGTKAMARHGTPPPRTVIAPPSRARDWKRTVFQMLSSEMKAHAGRIWTPSGTMPSCARRQSAIKSLRARATISVLRIAGAACVRRRYHWASALSFCSHRNRQASWIMPRRTRALPERAKPFSRRFAPLSSGEPVRPA